MGLCQKKLGGALQSRTWGRVQPQDMGIVLNGDQEQTPHPDGDSMTFYTT